MVECELISPLPLVRAFCRRERGRCARRHSATDGSLPASHSASLSHSRCSQLCRATTEINYRYESFVITETNCLYF